MQKTEFENKVQQQMQELRFQPSDEVWKRVEAGIAPRKRRRPLIIWFVIAGLLLGSSFYFIFLNQQRGSKLSDSSRDFIQPVTKHPSSNPAIQDESKVLSGNKIDDHLKQQQAESIGGPHLSTVRDNNNNSRQSQKEPGTSIALHERKNLEPASAASEPAFLENNINTPEINSDELQFNPTLPLIISRRKLISAQIINDNKVVMNSADTKVDIQKDSLLSQSSPQIHSPGKQKKWQWAIDASVGVADVSDHLFQPASAAGMNYYSNAVTNQSSMSSEVNKGISFSIGGFTSRSIGRKWKLRLGLSYQYFSNTMRVGERIDSARVINQGNSSMDRVNQYYKSAGNNRYINKYHFISLPAEVQWQLGKHIFWENSLAVSRLINTNTLHYDGVSGTYYQNRNLFNDYQLFASTSFLVSLYKSKLLAGPQFQYGLSNLLNGNSENTKHLRELGLKATLNLSKK